MGRRKKNLLGTLDIEGKHLSCSRWEMWPPTEVLIHEDPLIVRAELGNAAYHRVRIWQGACGLMKMDPDKCPGCPYVEIDGKVAKAPGGGFHKPFTTTATRIAQLRKKANDER